MTAKQNAARVHVAKHNHRSAKRELYDKLNAILTDLVDNYRTVTVVALILIVGNMTLRNVAYITGIVKGWW